MKNKIKVGSLHVNTQQLNDFHFFEMKVRHPKPVKNMIMLDLMYDEA